MKPFGTDHLTLDITGNFVEYHQVDPSLAHLISSGGAELVSNLNKVMKTIDKVMASPADAPVPATLRKELARGWYDIGYAARMVYECAVVARVGGQIGEAVTRWNTGIGASDN